MDMYHSWYFLMNYQLKFFISYNNECQVNLYSHSNALVIAERFECFLFGKSLQKLTWDDLINWGLGDIPIYTYQFSD